jgi:phosphoglycolate phosphatase
MNNIKCVVFDFDDTIVLSEQMKQNAFYEISTKYKQQGIEYYNNNISKKPTREQYFKGLSQHIIEHSLVDNESSIYLYTLLLDEFTQKVSENLKNSKELPNVTVFIEHLFNKGYKLYISSKSNEKDIIDTLKHKNLLKYFKGIYGLSNPKIEHFQHIQKLENIKGNEICFIGDSTSDYTTAYEAKCEFIGIITEINNFKDIMCNKITDYKQVLNLF